MVAYSGEALQQRDYLAERVDAARGALRDVSDNGDSFAESSWALSLYVGEETKAQLAANFFANLYDEIAKCDRARLCDHSLLVKFVSKPMKEHYNLLLPLIYSKLAGGTDGEVGSDYIDWLLTAKKCDGVQYGLVPYGQLDASRLEKFVSLVPDVKKTIEDLPKMHVATGEDIVCR